MTQAFNYLYDKNGKETALLIDLTNPEIEPVFKKPLNEAQTALLQTTSVINNERTLEEFRQLLAEFLLKNLLDEGDRIWEERNYNRETFDQLGNKS